MYSRINYYNLEICEFLNREQPIDGYALRLRDWSSFFCAAIPSSAADCQLIWPETQLQLDHLWGRIARTEEAADSWTVWGDLFDFFDFSD